MNILVGFEETTEDPFHDESMFKDVDADLPSRRPDMDVSPAVGASATFPVATTLARVMLRMIPRPCPLTADAAAVLGDLPVEDAGDILGPTFRANLNMGSGPPVDLGAAWGVPPLTGLVLAVARVVGILHPINSE